MKVAAVTPKIKLAEPEENARTVLSWLRVCIEQEVDLAVFPSLCLMGVTAPRGRPENVSRETLARRWLDDQPEARQIRYVLGGEAPEFVGGVLCVPGAELAYPGALAYRRRLLEAWSLRDGVTLVYAAAGPGESSAEGCYTGQRCVVQNGVTLAQDGLGLSNWEGLTAAEVQPNLLPFTGNSDALCAETLAIQVASLRARLEELNQPRVLLGLSGGADSAWAAVVAAKAVREPGQVLAVGMPGPGTTSRTADNAAALAAALGAEYRVIPIAAALRQHLQDIGHSGVPDLTFENAQARERTQILMDLANHERGFVLGTGDWSETALGFSTFGGDHLSMYGCNAGVPKTLLRALLRYEAARTESEPLRRVLADIAQTPVSPELLPLQAGQQLQLTEQILGDYEVVDFCLYYLLRHGVTGQDLARLCESAFPGRALASTAREVERRYAASRFKRSCMPEGISVVRPNLSPRT